MAAKNLGPLVLTDVRRSTGTPADYSRAYSKDAYTIRVYDRVVKAEGMKFPVTVTIVRRRLTPQGEVTDQ